MTRTIGTAMLGVLALTASACGSTGDAEQDGRISVAASTSAWGSVVAAVGGERVKVTSLIDESDGDPHSYESTASDVLDVSDSALFVFNGGGYDDFAGKLAEQADGVPTIETAELYGADEDDEHASEDEGGHGHDHGDVNEHFWYDFETVGKMADAVAGKLAEVDKAGAREYAANAEKFTAQLAKLTERLELVGEGEKADVVVTEPVAHHLLEAAGITDVTPPEFSGAIEEETDVPVLAQDKVTTMVEKKRVTAVINNPQTETPVTKQLIATAEKSGVPVVDVSETLPQGASGYRAWMTDQIDELAAAFGK